MTVDQFKEKEKELYEMYYDGLISKIDYYGKLYILIKDNLLETKQENCNQVNLINSYLGE